MRISLIAPCLLLGLACRSPLAPATPAAPATHLEVITGGAAAEAKLPMVIAIHGLGDSPEGFASLVRTWRFPARVILPRGFDAYPPGWSWFPIRVRQGDTPELGAGVKDAADRLAVTIAKLAAERPTAGRPIVTGFSQGGILAFVLAVQHPEVVAAAFPLSGMLPTALYPSAERPSAPIVALHGDDDPTVPMAGAEASVAAIVAEQGHAELLHYPGIGHQITDEMAKELERRIQDAIQKN